MSQPPEGKGSAYSSAGVDYATLDAGKRSALTEALATSGLLERAGGRAIDESRGEPAFVFEWGGQTLAFVLEGLGTKSIIARQLEDELGPDGFEHVAYDAVAAIVNDLCCVGALPLVGLVPQPGAPGRAAARVAAGLRGRRGGLGGR
jgi:phosphoribosylformylglycinamidine cyclo-ligase